MIHDENNKPSSTRVVLLVTLALFVGLTIADVSADIDVDPMTYTIIQTVLGLCLGGVALRSAVKNGRA